MACCPCCCETKQGGSCCGTGESATCCPEGEYCCDGVCQETECLGACCADDGSCTQTTEGDCTGSWHAGVGCGDIDCTSGCCESFTSPNDNCAYFACVRGEKAGCTPCDPDETQPQEPVVDCAGGSPSTATVSGSGYVAGTGTQPLDDDLERLMNGSYAVDISCAGSGAASFSDGNYDISVSVGLSTSRIAAIIISSFNNPLAQMDLIPAADLPISTPCGWDVYPCGGFSGAPTNTAGIGDFSGASINVTT